MLMALGKASVLAVLGTHPQCKPFIYVTRCHKTFHLASNNAATHRGPTGANLKEAGGEPQEQPSKKFLADMKRVGSAGGGCRGEGAAPPPAKRHRKASLGGAGGRAQRLPPRSVHRSRVTGKLPRRKIKPGVHRSRVTGKLPRRKRKPAR